MCSQHPTDTIVLAAPTDMFELTTPSWYVCARSTKPIQFVLTALKN